MAGATIAGAESKSHALKTHVSKLSANPLLIFPIVLAESGAIRIKSLNFLSSIWSTGSVRFDQAAHSSASSNLTKIGCAIFYDYFSRVSSLLRSSLRKWQEFFVGTRTTLKLAFIRV